MSVENSVKVFLKTSAAMLTTVVGFLLGADDENGETNPQESGSDLFGEYNFRTGNMDSGSDPDGWYEEDL